MSETELNPQPLPPKVDLGQLTETVTASVRKALEERAVTTSTPQVFRNPRIIIGIIMEPQALAE
jgi:hypothetical protein